MDQFGGLCWACGILDAQYLDHDHNCCDRVGSVVPAFEALCASHATRQKVTSDIGRRVITELLQSISPWDCWRRKLFKTIPRSGVNLMAGITIKSEGAAESIAAIESLKARIEIATRQATVTAGNTLQKKAVENFVGTHAPGEWHVGGPGSKPNTVSGNLQRSITVWPVVHEGLAQYRIQVNPTAIYARLIELGGTVTPKSAQYLSWIGRRSDASWGRIYKRRVTIAPHPYFEPAVRDTIAVMPRIFMTYWGGAIEA